jgi:thiosulfate reductase cytochrome b subunit
MACSSEEMTTATRVIEIEDVKTDQITEAVYEHPFVVRPCHWLNAISLFVMVGSGFQIFRAFPSFGAKIPQEDILNWPEAFALGGWLRGALQWHLTFMWIYIATGLMYVGYQVFSGNYKQVLFVRRDLPGVWPMVRANTFSSVRSRL